MTTDRQGQRRSGRRKRIVILLVCACAAVGVLVVGGLLVGRRYVAGAVVRRQLRALGAEGLGFRIAVLGSGASQVADLRVPDGAAQASSIGLLYSLGGLARLELKAVQIRGGDLPIHRDAGGWRVPLAAWLGQLRLPTRDPAKPASFLVSVPSVTVDAAIRLVHHRLGEWRLPARASLAVSPEQVRGSGDLQVLGDEQRFTVELTPELDGEVRVKGRLRNLAAFHTLCRYADLALPIELQPGGDGATVEVGVKLRKGQVAAVWGTARFSQVRLRWRGNDFSAGTFRLAARSASPDLAKWDVEGTASGLGGFGAVIPELVFTASGDANAGTLTVRRGRFRRGGLAGTVAGDVHWDEGNRIDGTLRVARLAVGELAIDGVVLAAKGNREAMDWELTWDGEASVYGLRSLALAGHASLAGDPTTTVGGQATVALDGVAERLGLPGCAGELSLDVADGTALRVASDGVAWEAKLAASCPELAVRAGGMRAGLSGLQMGLAGRGTTEVANLSLRADFLSGFVESGGVRVASKGGRLRMEAEGAALADVLALARQPLVALPEPSQAKLAVEVSAETMAADLGSLAKRMGAEGKLGGKLLASDLKAKAAWTNEGVTLETGFSGQCPVVSVTAPGCPRLRLPSQFQLRVSGSPERVIGTVSGNGKNGTVALDQAVAKVGTWQGNATLSGLSLAQISGLPAKLSQGQPMPPGGSLRLSGKLGDVACDLPHWASHVIAGPTSGQVTLQTVELGLVLDDGGLSGEASVSGTGHHLQTVLPEVGSLGGDLGFSANIQGTPASLSGNTDIVLTDARWQRGEMAFAAGKVRSVVSYADLPASLALALARDPLGARDRSRAAKASVLFALNDGKLAGVAGGELAGISVAGNAVHWTARDGWQTGKDGLRFGVGDATMRGVHVKEATGNLSLAGTDLQLAAALPLTGPGVTVALKGEVELSPRPSMHASLLVPEFAMSTDQGWVLGLGGFGGMAFSANVSGTANMVWAPDHLTFGLGVGIKNGTLALPEDAGEVAGIDTKLSLRVLPAVVSEPDQLLTFSAARIGRVSLDKGHVRYRVDGLKDLFVEEAHAGWSGGSLDTYALRFDAAKTDVEAVVHASEVDVGRFVELFPGIEGTGQGKLYGRLPAFRRDGRFGYGEGFLYGIPGEQGFLQLTKLGLLRDPITKMGRTGKIVEDSLRDFAYSLFRVDIKPEGHEHEGVRIRIVGAKAGQSNARPVTLDVNINGAIEEALNLGVKVAGIKRIFESVGALRRALLKLAE